MKKVERLSASGLKKFVTCPKQFMLHYLSDIESPEEEEPEFFDTGNCVHDSIEYVLKEYDLEEIKNEDDFFDILKEEQIEYNNQDNDTVDNCFRTASRWIPSFVQSANHVEEEWSMERDGIEYNGLADLVADVEIGGKTYENTIVDWKTGSETEPWKERVQAGMYIEMFYDKFDHYPEAAVFVYLDEETQSFHSRIQDGEVFWNEHENKYWTEIEKIKNKIILAQQKSEWEAKPEQSKCYWCSYKYYCSDSPIGAEDVGMNEIEMGEWL